MQMVRNSTQIAGIIGTHHRKGPQVLFILRCNMITCCLLVASHICGASDPPQTLLEAGDSLVSKTHWIIEIQFLRLRFLVIFAH